MIHQSLEFGKAMRPLFAEPVTYMQYKKISFVYILIICLQQINQQRDTLINHHHFLPLK